LPACRTGCRNPGSEKALIAALPKISFPKDGGANEQWNQIHIGGKSFSLFSYPGIGKFYLGEGIGLLRYVGRAAALERRE
jgi:hypothetical protein